MLHDREEVSRADVLARAEDFMNKTGLSAVDRDIIRAFRDIAYWKLRQKELWARIELAIAPGVRHLADHLDLSQEQLLMMGVDELSSVLADPKSQPSKDLLDVRLKKKFSALFVEDLIEPEWV